MALDLAVVKEEASKESTDVEDWACTVALCSKAGDTVRQELLGTPAVVNSTETSHSFTTCERSEGHHNTIVAEYNNNRSEVAQVKEELESNGSWLQRLAGLYAESDDEQETQPKQPRESDEIKTELIEEETGILNRVQCEGDSCSIKMSTVCNRMPQAQRTEHITTPPMVTNPVKSNQIYKLLSNTIAPDGTRHTTSELPTAPAELTFRFSRSPFVKNRKSDCVVAEEKPHSVATKNALLNVKKYVVPVPAVHNGILPSPAVMQHGLQPYMVNKQTKQTTGLTNIKVQHPKVTKGILDPPKITKETPPFIIYRPSISEVVNRIQKLSVHRHNSQPKVVSNQISKLLSIEKIIPPPEVTRISQPTVVANHVSQPSVGNFSQLSVTNISEHPEVNKTIPSEINRSLSSPVPFDRQSRPPLVTASVLQTVKVASDVTRPIKIGNRITQSSGIAKQNSKSILLTTNGSEFVFNKISSQPSMVGNNISQPSVVSSRISQPSVVSNISTQPSIVSNNISQPSMVSNISSQPYRFRQPSMRKTRPYMVYKNIRMPVATNDIQSSSADNCSSLPPEVSNQISQQQTKITLETAKNTNCISHRAGVAEHKAPKPFVVERLPVATSVPHPAVECIMPANLKLDDYPKPCFVKLERIKLLTCAVCRKRFHQRSDFVKHVFEHVTASRMARCKICRKLVARSRVKVHERAIHGPRQYWCDHCGKKCAEKSALVDHLRIHSGEKPFRCQICKTNYRTSSNLVSHNLMHKNLKSHPCTICDKEFKRRTSLNKHLQYHHLCLRQHKCLICEKLFYQRSHLESHKIIHTGERPYGCGICKKSFSRSLHRDNHMLMHARRKSNTCTICKKQFTRKDQLQKHVSYHEKYEYCD